MAQNPAAPDAGRVKAGGNADLGKPLDNQNYGEAKTNPKDYSTPVPQPQTNRTSRATANSGSSSHRTDFDATPHNPRPHPAPNRRLRSDPEPTAHTSSRTDGYAETPSRQRRHGPKGPTRDAQPTRQVQPDIPDDLKKRRFQIVGASSRRGFRRWFLPAQAYEALPATPISIRAYCRRCGAGVGKPALKDGEAVSSTQYFSFRLRSEISGGRRDAIALFGEAL